jgi:hypothetical protein
VPSPLAQSLYFTRQHYRRTVPSREYTNKIIIPNNWEYEKNTNTKAIDERYKRLYDGDKD